MFKQGDILLIPVPFSDLTSIKRRPVLVLSNSEYNNISKDIIVVAITSNLLQNGIKISNNDMSTGFLPKVSVVKIDKVYTLEQSIVIKNIGKVNEYILKNVFDEFVKLIKI